MCHRKSENLRISFFLITLTSTPEDSRQWRLPTSRCWLSRWRSDIGSKQFRATRPEAAEKTEKSSILRKLNYRKTVGKLSNITSCVPRQIPGVACASVMDNLEKIKGLVLGVSKVKVSLRSSLLSRGILFAVNKKWISNQTHEVLCLPVMTSPLSHRPSDIHKSGREKMNNFRCVQSMYARTSLYSEHNHTTFLTKNLAGKFSVEQKVAATAWSVAFDFVKNSRIFPKQFDLDPPTKRTTRYWRQKLLDTDNHASDRPNTCRCGKRCLEVSEWKSFHFQMMFKWWARFVKDIRAKNVKIRETTFLYHVFCQLLYDYVPDRRMEIYVQLSSGN